MAQHRTIDWAKLTVSEDQNTIKSFRFGAATFVPSSAERHSCDCEKCLFKSEPECIKAPCDEIDRKDHRNGYWWKHIDKEHSPN